MRKTRVKWLHKNFQNNLDPQNEKGDFRRVKKWWNKLPTPEKRKLSNINR